ncbi:MAG: hypothetical protein L0Y60_14065 [Beijerinckiaceae bacterium]|nr:hypothetical protein [Beijerinckiaceae bacterium]
MVYRLSLRAAALVSCLALTPAAAVAQALDASVSGPANGTNVVPSAAVQKQIERRSVSDIAKDQPSALMGSALSAGAPGLEGAPGAKSGRNPRR